jgi:hypothetical protein
LLQDDAGFSEADVGQRRADGAHAGGDHPGVGVDEGEHPRAVVEGAGDNGGEVVPRGEPPQSFAQRQHLAGP